jgi:hypothetical protein
MTRGPRLRPEWDHLFIWFNPYFTRSVDWEHILNYSNNLGNSYRRGDEWANWKLGMNRWPWLYEIGNLARTLGLTHLLLPYKCHGIFLRPLIQFNVPSERLHPTHGCLQSHILFRPETTGSPTTLPAELFQKLRLSDLKSSLTSWLHLVFFWVPSCFECSNTTIHESAGS